MKTRLFFLSLMLATTAHLKGQDMGKWSVGVGVMTYGNGIRTNLSINRNIGHRFQVGLMPSFEYAPFNTSNGYFTGINLSTRFYILKEKKVLPYIYGYGGYLMSSVVSRDGSYPEKWNGHGYNYSLGLGLQLQLKKGWSLDFNIGFFEYHLNYENQENWGWYPDYSIGIRKRLGKLKKD